MNLQLAKHTQNGMENKKINSNNYAQQYLGETENVYGGIYNYNSSSEVQQCAFHYFT